MDYQKVQKLPVIDFSSESLKPGSSYWQSTAKEVCNAFEEYSCFLAVLDKVPFLGPFLELSKGLFDLPLERKSSYKPESDIPIFGYTGKSPQRPLFECLAIKKGTSFEEVSRLTTKMWPSGNDHYRDLMHSYAKKVSELEQMIRRMMFESYGVEDSCDDHLNSTTYILRLNKYSAPKQDDTNVGLGAHTDNAFSGIQHSQDNGLEVKLKDGTWVAVDFPPNSFIILAGDGMMAWSNGRIRHCVHRVIMAEQERCSIGMFSVLNGIVQVPGVFVDENHPRNFKDFDHWGLLRFRLANPQIPEGERLQAYCGVR